MEGWSRLPIVQYSLDVVNTENEDKSRDKSLTGGLQRMLSCELLFAPCSSFHDEQF
jgi:hypothetical protein